MTNIDKLKAAAAKAVDNFDPNMFVETRDVLALLDELEAKDRQILKLQKLAEAESVGADKAATSGVEWMKLYHAAEKRIAELEGREVVLPSAHDVHPLGPQSAKIFCEFHRSIVNRCADEIRKVGVKVSIKGN
ncbi:ead/Ea22-like family protein [Enterobacter hormaechei]|uniref:ead/Ea22-like family protein n=1 Tax=Enterobacter hormaechei TaxID=158836 RepID=UPI001F21E92E|nr:ead/Ea22-like family protein [Enterobacter hormaechei]